MMVQAVALRCGDVVQLRLPVPRAGAVHSTEFHLPASCSVAEVIDHVLRETSEAVAVEAFGWGTHLDAIRGLGAQPVLRRDAQGRPYTTDDGHFILDCRFPAGITDPEAVAEVLRSRPGVVETGLFLGFSREVIVGRA